MRFASCEPCVIWVLRQRLFTVAKTASRSPFVWRISLIQITEPTRWIPILTSNQSSRPQRNWNVMLYTLAMASWQKMPLLLLALRRKELPSLVLHRASSPCWATRLKLAQRWRLLAFLPQRARQNPSPALMLQANLQMKSATPSSSKQQPVVGA